MKEEETLATKRKIVLLGPYPPPHGGVSVFVSALFEFTKDEGVRLWAAGESLPKASNVRPINYRRLGLIPLLVRDGRGARIFDSFHFLIEYPNFLMVPLWTLLKRVLRFEWIKVVHDGSLPSRYAEFSRLRKLLFAISVGAVDEFVAVGEEIEKFLRGTVGVRQRITNINSLLPLPPGELNAALPEDVRSALARYERLVVSTGVFIPDYGFAHAAEAVERVRRETGENVGLVLLDGAFVRNDDYRDAVLRGRDWISVLEKVPHAQALQIFRRSDAFVRAFRHESYGLSRVEAIWCGAPVVAARGGEERGMLLYDFGDVENLVERLRDALKDASANNVEQWAEVFRREAEENLERWKKIMEVS